MLRARVQTVGLVILILCVSLVGKSCKTVGGLELVSLADDLWLFRHLPRLATESLSRRLTT